MPNIYKDRILVVQDDADLALLVRDYLEKYDFNVDIISNGQQAAHLIVNTQPSLVILDVMLPGINGMDVCREVRAHYSGPILMLTALDDDMDQMLGLELGADDYIIKPVQPRLLLTRVRTLLRRVRVDDTRSLGQYTQPPQTLRIGVLDINMANRCVLLAGKPIDLTSAEYELLLLLAQDVGQVVERNTIVQELRGFDYDGLDRSIDRRISRLRNKLTLGDHPNIIKTVHGKGYQLCTVEA